jgi:hypothetical protein
MNDQIREDEIGRTSDLAHMESMINEKRIFVESLKGTEA